MTEQEVRQRLLRGEWYTFSPSHHIRWKVTRVYGDGTFDKLCYDTRTGMTRAVLKRTLDIQFHALVGLFIKGQLCFV